MPRVTHFEVPADDPARAQKFYSQVFGWKFDKWDGPMEYWMTITGDNKEPGINGGLMKRVPGQFGITNYIEVSSIDEFLNKIRSNGGNVIVPKTSISEVGYFAKCTDTEGNIFGIIQLDKKQIKTEKK